MSILPKKQNITPLYQKYRNISTEKSKIVRSVSTVQIEMTNAEISIETSQPTGKFVTALAESGFSTP